MLSFGLLALPLAVAAPLPKDPPKKEPPSLVGEWVLESRTTGGVVGPPFTLSGGLRYTFPADGECVVSPGPGVPPGRYSFAADPKADPPALALRRPGPRAEMAVDGIYKVEGDTMTLCWDHAPGGARPKAFESPAGTQVRLYVFKRVKKE
jgi:uncharacterized protein (TIGR03067 family)